MNAPLSPRLDLTTPQCKELGESLLRWSDAELGTDVMAICDWDAVEDLLRGKLPQPYCFRSTRPPNQHEGLAQMLLDDTEAVLSPEVYDYLERELLAELINNTPTSDAMDFDGVDHAPQRAGSSRAFSLWVAPAFIGNDRIADGIAIRAVAIR